MNTATKYMGFQLKNPIIAGSSGLTNSVENIIEFEKHGAAAVILKSLFEEQINLHYHEKLSEFKMESTYPEAEEYISHHTRVKDVEDYLELIRGAKKAVSIPVIASLNCVSASEWTFFAKEIELAGADGIELNVFILPSDTNLLCGQVEEMYLDIVNDVQSVAKTSARLTRSELRRLSGILRWGERRARWRRRLGMAEPRKEA